MEFEPMLTPRESHGMKMVAQNQIKMLAQVLRNWVYDVMQKKIKQQSSDVVETCNFPFGFVVCARSQQLGPLRSKVPSYIMEEEEEEEEEGKKRKQMEKEKKKEKKKKEKKKKKKLVRLGCKT